MLLAQVSISRKLTIAFGILVVLSVTSSAMSIVKMRAVADATKWNNHTYEVLGAADQVGASMVDQETGVRGYLIAGNDSFLAPYQAGAQNFDKAYQSLKSLTADNPTQQERIAALSAAADGWRSHVAEAEISGMKNPATAANARQMEASGAGKTYMDQIRGKLDEIRNAERGLLVTRTQRQASDQAQGELTLIIGGVAGVLAAIAMGWMLTRAIAAPINLLNVVMQRLAKGELEAEVPGTDRRDEVGAMAQTVQVFKEAGLEKVRLEGERQAAAAELAKVVDALADGLGRLSNGDLTHRVNHTFAAEYERLRHDFNDAMGKLQQAMSSVLENTGSIGSGSVQISDAADDLSKRTEQQAAGLEETAAALDQITATVRKTAEGAEHAREVVSSAKRDAETSGEVVRRAVEAMSAIERSSQQIGQIIGVIDEIAFQTNLLALNAGVEAARAGDAGKGFAVVASEVRALAQRSAEAAKEIKGLINTSTEQVSGGVKLVGDTGEALNRIAAQVAEINGIVTDIAASAQEQATGLHQVNTAVNQMDQVTQQNAAMVEESTAASHALAREAESLRRLMGQFSIGAGSPRPVETAAAAPAPASPAREQQKRVANAFATQGATALKTEQWEEF